VSLIFVALLPYENILTTNFSQITAISSLLASSSGRCLATVILSWPWLSFIPNKSSHIALLSGSLGQLKIGGRRRSNSGAGCCNNHMPQLVICPGALRFRQTFEY